MGDLCNTRDSDHAEDSASRMENITAQEERAQIESDLLRLEEAAKGCAEHAAEGLEAFHFLNDFGDVVRILKKPFADLLVVRIFEKSDTEYHPLYWYKSFTGLTQLGLRRVIYTSEENEFTSLHKKLPSLTRFEHEVIQDWMQSQGSFATDQLQHFFFYTKDHFNAQPMILYPRLPRACLSDYGDDYIENTIRSIFQPDEEDKHGGRLWEKLNGGTLGKGHLCCSRVRGMGSLKSCRALAGAPMSSTILDSPIAAGILQVVWSEVAICYYIDLAVEICAVVALMVASSAMTTGKPSLGACVVAAACTSKFVCDEIGQWLFSMREIGGFRGSCKYWCRDMNILDNLWLVLEVWGVVKLFQVRTEESASIESLGVLALWAMIRWAKTVSGLRGIATFGLTYMPILRTLKASAPMLCFTAGALCALTHAVYLLAPRSDPPSHFYSSLLLTFRLGILGDFDRYEVEGTDTIFVGSGGVNPSTFEPEDPAPTEKFWYIQVWLAATTILLQVLLLQLFVGVLGAKYDLHEENARPMFLQDRAKLICRLETRTAYRWYFDKVSSRLENRYVTIYVKDDESMDATSIREVVRTSRTGITAELKQDIRRLEATVADSLKKVHELLASKETTSEVHGSV